MSLYRSCLLAIAFLTVAQNSLWSQQTPASPKEILITRLERLQNHQDTCVVVNSTGKYRLEQIYASATQVFSGDLAASDLTNLEQMLDVEALKVLSQDRVAHVLTTDTLDEFFLAIFRSDRIQRLAFVSPETRKPYRAALDPLLKWMDWAQKQKHVKLPESAANRCVSVESRPPDGSPGVSAISKTPAAQQLDYLLRISTDHAFGGNVTKTCVILGKAGSYRMEKSSQSVAINGSLQVRVFEASLSPDELRDLSTLLEDKALTALPSQPPAPVGLSQEITVTHLTIPRSEGTQTLVLSSNFEVHSIGREAGGLGNMRYQVEQDLKPVHALRDWIQSHVEKKKLPVVKGAQPNGCSSAP